MRGLQAVSSPILFGYCTALTLHIQAASDQAEIRRAQPPESAFCTSFIPHSNNQKKILYCSNLKNQLKQAPHITFFPLGLWQVSACLNRCHQHLSTLSCAAFVLLIPLFCLREQTGFYNLNIHLVARDG